MGDEDLQYLEAELDDYEADCIRKIEKYGYIPSDRISAKPKAA